MCMEVLQLKAMKGREIRSMESERGGDEWLLEVRQLLRDSSEGSTYYGHRTSFL